MDFQKKVGGWSSLITDTIVGVARAQHAFVDLDGNRYVAIGTDKFLLIYFEGQLHDITPLKTTLTSATIATTNNSATCTITKSAHGLAIGDIIQLDNVTLPGGTGYQNSDFEDKNFQVITVPTTSTFTITQASSASATVSTGGSLSINLLNLLAQENSHMVMVGVLIHGAQVIGVKQLQLLTYH